MKKLFIFSLSALLVLAGCSSETASADQENEPAEAAVTETESQETTAVAIDPEPMESELEPIEVNRTLSAIDYFGGAAWRSAGNPVGGNGASDFVPGREPSVAFFKDGTFIFTENLYNRMGTYTGTYDLDDNYGAILTVKNHDLKGYKGENVKEIHLLHYGDYNLQLDTDLCASEKGDIFGWIPTAAGEGSYIFEDDIVNDEFKPAVRFNSDSTFEMKENLLAGMGTYSGYYVFDDQQWFCKVENINFEGCKGDDVNLICFEKFYKDKISIGTDLCMSEKGSGFIKTDSVDTYTKGNKKTEPEGPIGYVAGPVTNDEYRAGTVFIVANASANCIKIRSGPGLKAVDTGRRAYNTQRVAVYDEKVMDGYTWYQIGPTSWMAGNGTSFGIKFD